VVASALVPIAVALAVIVIVPGPNVLAVTTTAMRDRRAGVLMALGVSAGDLVWAASALAGLGAILAHARPVFEAMRWAGAAYLLWFAIRLWRSSGASSVPATPMRTTRRAFWRGMLVDLANPKAAIFFTTLFASLLPTHFGVGFALAVLVVVAAIVSTWYVLLAVVFSRPVVQRGYRRVGRTVNRVAAGAIGVLGVRLVLDA
jgi:threonine/homoserine/homoserine lactone efflux protein